MTSPEMLGNGVRIRFVTRLNRDIYRVLRAGVGSTACLSMEAILFLTWTRISATTVIRILGSLALGFDVWWICLNFLFTNRSVGHKDGNAGVAEPTDLASRLIAVV